MVIPVHADYRHPFLADAHDREQAKVKCTYHIDFMLLFSFTHVKRLTALVSLAFLFIQRYFTMELI